MSPGPIDDLARRRFTVIQLVRIGGTVVTLLGLLLWQSDRLVEGGSFLGFPIALIGLAISFGGPCAFTLPSCEPSAAPVSPEPWKKTSSGWRASSSASPAGRYSQ